MRILDKGLAKIILEYLEYLEYRIYLRMWLRSSPLKRYPKS